MAGLKTLDDIDRLYAARGGLHYGEGVTQIEHAVQCASLAEADGAAPALIAAALLHDIGHLIEHEQDIADFARDHRHERTGADALTDLFGAAVCEPIALHVAAKRYLCRDAAYAGALSTASRRSLELQGGPFSQAEATAFERQPWSREAITLRRYDDEGKCDEAARRRFENFMPLLRGLLVSQPRQRSSPARGGS